MDLLIFWIHFTLLQINLSLCTQKFISNISQFLLLIDVPSRIVLELKWYWAFMCIQVGLVQGSPPCLQTLNEIYLVGHLSLTFQVAVTNTGATRSNQYQGFTWQKENLNHFSGKSRSPWGQSASEAVLKAGDIQALKMALERSEEWHRRVIGSPFSSWGQSAVVLGFLLLW